MEKSNKNVYKEECRNKENHEEHQEHLTIQSEGSVVRPRSNDSSENDAPQTILKSICLTENKGVPKKSTEFTDASTDGNQEQLAKASATCTPACPDTTELSTKVCDKDSARTSLSGNLQTQVITKAELDSLLDEKIQLSWVKMTNLCGVKHRTNFVVPLALDLEWDARCVLSEYESGCLMIKEARMDEKQDLVPGKSSVTRVLPRSKFLCNLFNSVYCSEK